MIKSTQITILFISLFYFQCNGQQLITDITANATEENGKLDDIYQLNVFSYYNLEEYDTELKKSVFKKTTEYQNYLTELKTKKAEMQKTTYYTIKTDMFNDTNYDVKRKGFEIEIGTNSGLGTFTARTPKSIYLENGSRIILKGLPIKQKPEPYVAKGVFSENLFLQISEENGLEIENSRENIQVYYFFTPTGLEITTFKFYNFDNGRYRGWYTINNNDLKSETVRVIVANKETGFIYFDKFYNYQAMKKK
jgi:hypothetical protein